ncbi:MAG: putative sulfate/molybdate transporter [Methanosarcinaceae archaeon]|nr:putative sulfate/molybdate transporter [Methanosarcinaceae archaeon]
MKFESITGSIGNFGTVLPITLAIAVASEVNFGAMLLFFGMWYIVMSIFYNIPMSIEPMKAMGAIVIVGEFTQHEIAASGIFIGLIFFFIGSFKGMRFVQKKVPMSVIKGIQIGLALILFNTTIDFILKDLIFGIVCILIIVIISLYHTRLKIPNISALLCLFLGIVVGIYVNGMPQIEFLQIPVFIIPSMTDFFNASWHLVLPQLPLTLTNSILMTSILSKEFFKKNIEPDTLSTTIGVMNIVSAPFGGFPTCHGAGGIAAHYRFNATTISNIVGGVVLITIALFFASPAIISMLPSGMFGALLIFVAITLIKSGFDTDSLFISIITALFSVFINIPIAFIFGISIVYATKYLKK